MKLPARLSNAKLARARLMEELEWLRPSDCPTIDLPRPLVLVNGSFDILHSGHMKLLFEARKRAGMRGTVVVAMDSDRRVAEKKAGRPIQSWIERATSLSYMPIDYLIEFDSTEEFATIINGLKPDLRVQGYDYLNNQTAYPAYPRVFVRDGGMRTSIIIERIKHAIQPKV